MADSQPQRFACTPRGDVARSRARRRHLLAGLGLFMLMVTAWTLWNGRPGPAVLAFAVTLLVFAARRMSGELDLLWLEVDGGWLVIRRRRRLDRIALDQVEARLLTPPETEHLTGLASHGGLLLGSAGFDSHLLGEFDLHATHLEAPVLLKTEERSLILTPDDAEGFLRAIRRGRS